jgi:hypothetical protein
MAAAFLAVLALAQSGLLVHADMLCTRSDTHRIRFPKRESIDRSA